MLAGVFNKHASPSRQKEASLPTDLMVMLATLDRGTLRGLGDRAMLLPARCAGNLAFANLIAYARAGDTLAIVRLDRLGRSLAEMLETVQMLRARQMTC